MAAVTPKKAPFVRAAGKRREPPKTLGMKPRKLTTSQEHAVVDRTITAFHEAGHVVVALRWGSPPQRVTIRATKHALGRCEQRAVIYTDAEDVPRALRRNQHLRLVRFALAGLAAEELLTRKPRFGAAVDTAAFCDDADWLDVHFDLVDDVRAACEHMAKAYPRSSHAPERLAAEYRTVLDFLRAHWPHVRAIARALIARETLTEDDVWTALDGLHVDHSMLTADDRAVTRALDAMTKGRR